MIINNKIMYIYLIFLFITSSIVYGVSEEISYVLIQMK